MKKDKLTKKEKQYKEILDGIVKIYHKICETHGFSPCNCFREETGQFLLKHFNIKTNPYRNKRREFYIEIERIDEQE